MDAPGLLTEDHYQQIKNALDVIELVKPEVDKASRAGINVDDQRRTIADVEKRLLALKNVYFPGR